MLGKTAILATTAVMMLPFGGADAPAAMQAGEAWERPLSFTLEPSDGGAGERVDLSLRHGEGNRRSHYGRTIDLADLEGIGALAALGEGAPVRFRMVREAGVLDCSGTARSARAAGDCRFTPDAGFAAELDRRGIGRPDAEQQFHLAMAGVGRPLIEELDRQGYERPGFSDLVALGIHGASVDHVRGIADAGYRLRELDRLVEFRIHGVTPTYISELTALGAAWREMPAQRLVEMRIHGVTPAFAREMASLGYAGLEPQDLVGMRIHGVTPAYVREMAAAGYPNLSAEQLLSLRIHGVRAADAQAINEAVARGN